jgi:hypothetical protein
VDGGARKPPPSGDRWLRSGDRWLRSSRSHPLPSGGQRREKTTTVWRQVATVWRQVAKVWQTTATYGPSCPAWSLSTERCARWVGR